MCFPWSGTAIALVAASVAAVSVAAVVGPCLAVVDLHVMASKIRKKQKIESPWNSRLFRNCTVKILRKMAIIIDPRFDDDCHESSSRCLPKYVVPMSFSFCVALCAAAVDNVGGPPGHATSSGSATPSAAARAATAARVAPATALVVCGPWLGFLQTYVFESVAHGMFQSWVGRFKVG